MWMARIVYLAMCTARKIIKSLEALRGQGDRVIIKDGSNSSGGGNNSFCATEFCLLVNSI